MALIVGAILIYVARSPGNANSYPGSGAVAETYAQGILWGWICLQALVNALLGLISFLRKKAEITKGDVLSALILTLLAFLLAGSFA